MLIKKQPRPKKVMFFEHNDICLNCPFCIEAGWMNEMWTSSCLKPGKHPDCPLNGSNVMRLRKGRDGMLHRIRNAKEEIR